jgi:hypothetical protein
MDDSEAAKRLMRLLIAGFRYVEAVDGSIWLNHPRSENGRVIFYPDGQVSSLRSGDDEFYQIWLEDTDLFERYVATLKPTRKRDRLFAWGDDIITWTMFLILIAVVAGVMQWVSGAVGDWWNG